MRNRSESIYSLNQENFFHEIDLSLSSSRREKKFSNKTSKLKLYEEFEESDTDDSENNQLGASKFYKIEEIPLSLREIEIIEENKINNFIMQLNTLYKIENDLFYSKGKTINPFPKEIELTEKFLTQNIVQYDENVKIMMLSAININTRDEDDRKFNSNCIEIKKEIYNIYNRKVKIEILDALSMKEQSKLLSVYYEIYEGIVIIAQLGKIDFNGLKRQILTIREKNRNNSNVLLFITKEKNGIGKEREIERVKVFAEENKVLLEIVEIFSFNKGLLKEFIYAIVNRKKTQRKENI